MTRLTRMLLFLLVLPMAVVAEEAPEPGSDAEAMQAMMAAFAKYTTPGEKHALFERWLGTWDVEMSVIIPGGTPQKSQGTSSCQWQIAGRFVSCALDGSLMGMPYQSFGVFGYDNFKKKHVWTGFDSASTAILRAEGVVVDPTEKVQALYGTLDEYLTGENDKPFKVIVRWHSDDHHVVEVWDLGIGETGAKVLDFQYRRKKASS